MNDNIAKIHDLCNKNNELLLINKQKILSKENYNDSNQCNNFENYTNSPNTENCFKKNTSDDLESLNENILTLEESTESINLNSENNVSSLSKENSNNNNSLKSKSNKSNSVENNSIK